MRPREMPLNSTSIDSYTRKPSLIQLFTANTTFRFFIITQFRSRTLPFEKP